MSSSADRSAERRLADRRRQRRTNAADESWFGAFSADGDTQVRDDERLFGASPVASPSAE